MYNFNKMNSGQWKELSRRKAKSSARVWIEKRNFAYEHKFNGIVTINFNRIWTVQFAIIFYRLQIHQLAQSGQKFRQSIVFNLSACASCVCLCFYFLKFLFFLNRDFIIQHLASSLWNSFLVHMCVSKFTFTFIIHYEVQLMRMIRIQIFFFFSNFAFSRHKCGRLIHSPPFTIPPYTANIHYKIRKFHLHFWSIQKIFEQTIQ